MGHINPSLGFVPDSIEDIISRLRQQLELMLGITYQSDEEFADTNIYRLFLGFAKELARLEDGIVYIMDSYVSWIRKTNNQIGFSKSGTYSGIMEAFLEHFKGVSISSGNTNSDIPPGVALVAIDNTDENNELPSPRVSEIEAENLHTIFHDYWPAGIFTHNPQVIPAKDSNDPYIHKVSVQTNDHDARIYQVAMVKPHPLRVQIAYKPLAHAVIPGAQDETLRNMFLKSFEEQNAIGRDFDPESYLSTQNVPWLAQCICQWQELNPINIDEYNAYRYIVPNYYEKFVIAKDENTGLPLISVKVLD